MAENIVQEPSRHEPKRDSEALRVETPFTEDGGTLRKNQDSQPSIHVDENGEIRGLADPENEFDAAATGVAGKPRHPSESRA